MIFQKTETVTGTYIPELNDALCTGAHLIDAIPKSETLSLYFAGEKRGHRRPAENQRHSG